MEPLASRPDPPDPIYETYYGLKEQPFAISTDPRFFYLGAAHNKAYRELLTGLRRDEGMLLLTGEAGTGKTTLCRAVIEALGERTFSAIVLNPYMTGAEMLKLVIRDFGLVSREELRTGALAKADTPQLLDMLEGFLLSVRSVESRAIVVIDEAQSLAPRVLDHVRQLTGLERRGKRLLQIILSGQPMLLQTLKKDSMYALNERISRRVHLAPMDAGEIDAYIRHRLKVAGGESAVSFHPDASGIIAALSRGLPRRVNLLADRALQVGLAEKVNVIGPKMVTRAAQALSGGAGSGSAAPRSQRPDLKSVDERPVVITRPPSRQERRRRRRLWLMAAAAVVVIVGALAYWYVATQTLDADPDVPSGPPAPERAIGTPPPEVVPPTEMEFEVFRVGEMANPRGG